MMRPSVLIFAGSDPSGGAGLQADIQAVSALGAHPLTAVTALTVQDNDRVFKVHPVPAGLVQQQAHALMDKMEIAAVKIGIVGNRENAEAIADTLRVMKQRRPDLHVVLDPVLASGHGDALAADNAVRTVMPLLRPLLASILSALDPTVDNLLQTLGLQLGTLDVTVHGVSCGRATLFG